MAKITGLIKRSAISLILVAVFYLLALAIIKPLLAEIKASEAAGLIKQYKWQQADAALRRAIDLDPSNAAYYAKLGDFIFAQASYHGYKESSVREAEKLYRYAIDLDPRNAQYWLKLGQAKIIRKEYAKAFEYFRAAAKNDPYGYNIAFDIGEAGLKTWKNINEEDRAFVADRLKAALMVRPSWDLYAKVWNSCKDPALLKAIRPESLRGPKKRSTQRAYKNGNMYWSGTMDRAIDVPEGNVAIKVRAKGQPAGGIWPYMIVELDGKEIGGVFVDSGDWKEYEFKAASAGGTKVLSVTFTNDGGNAKEDRNLFVGTTEALKAGGAR